MAINNHFREHDAGVDYLVQRLIQKNYDDIQVNVCYHVMKDGKYVDGEVDVMARRGEFLHCYEVKYRHTYGNERKAKSQLKRYVKTHPEENVKKIYYTTDGTVKYIR